MPKHTTGEQFLHHRDPKLHSSKEVESVVGYLRTAKEKIPNDPAHKIGAYVSFLADKDNVNDGILTGDEESIQRQIEAHIISATDVPDSYFKLQYRILREQGMGNVKIDDNERQRMTDTIREEQRASLQVWANYLTDKTNRATYPAWFRKYAWEGILQLGRFNKQKNTFESRSQKTVAPYADLNAEALAYVYEALEQSFHRSSDLSDEVSRLAGIGKFSALYTHAILELTPVSIERREVTAGSWKKYDAIEGEYEDYYEQDDDGEYRDDFIVDNETANQLAASLRGYGTGWCTAGSRTAAYQLSMGDFYVYYSQDEAGKDTIPRVAIRMEYDQVAEVRGVNQSQALESNMLDIAKQKLGELPGGEEYSETIDQLRWMTKIDNKTANGEPLTDEDLLFFYTKEIINRDYGPDPRFDEIREKRDQTGDIAHLVKIVGTDELFRRLLAGNRRKIIAENIEQFKELSPELMRELIDRLLASGYGNDNVLLQYPEVIRRAGIDIVELYKYDGRLQPEAVDAHYKTLLQLGVPAEKLVWMMSGNGVRDNYEDLQRLGAKTLDYNGFTDKELSEFYHPSDINTLIAHGLAEGIDPTAMARIPQPRNLIYWIDAYLEAGAQIDLEIVLASAVRDGKYLPTPELEKLLRNGVGTEQIVATVDPASVLQSLPLLRKYGAQIDFDAVLSEADSNNIANSFKELVEMGVPKQTIIEHIDAIHRNRKWMGYLDSHSAHGLIENGVSPELVAAWLRIPDSDI